MNHYSYTLTPPSSNEDSPQYTMNPSPQSYMTNPSPQSYIMNPSTQAYTMNTSPQTYMMSTPAIQYRTFHQTQPAAPHYSHREPPFLRIVEQPVDKFRFRYKSEMAGTHGSLIGMNAEKNRRQIYPTVRLENYDGRAVVKCSLYQISTSAKRGPHAHRLIRKQGNEELDDPHEIEVGSAVNYEACFHSMGIIHTAKKNLIEELKRKLRIIKEEEIARKERKRRMLRMEESIALAKEAEEEARRLNLNIVCLRFDAYRRTDDGILDPICSPVYSHSINNLKSALTGELKIVRMDHSSSPAKGNREIFMLVEKVTKKNIKIRFFELDSDEAEIWSEFGKFSDLDVHHQYAIVFRTPPYKDLQITEPRVVFVELYRPTDGARSEARDFRYVPNPGYQPGMKRARMSNYPSSSFTSSNEFNSSENAAVPATVPSGPNVPEPINYDNMILDSEEFKKLFLSNEKDFDITDVQFSSFGIDSPRWSVPRANRLESNINKDQIMINRVNSELLSLLETRPKQEEVLSMLSMLFREYVNSNKDNALHLLTMNGNRKALHIWLETLRAYNQLHLINLPNKKRETIAHLALRTDDVELCKLVLRYKPDLGLRDDYGNTPLHVAVIENKSVEVIDMMLRSGQEANVDVDALNNDDYSALQTSVKMHKLSFVKLLCNHGANVNINDQKSGYNLLHLAIAEESLDITRYLLQNPAIDLLKPNYRGMTPFRMATELVADKNTERRAEIARLIETEMIARGLSTDVTVKEESESEDEEMDVCDVPYKSENFTNDELAEMYKNVKCFTQECLEKVSTILNESGSWNMLAELLDLNHITCTEDFKKNPSRNLLTWAQNICDLHNIRTFLENLEELEAVRLMDQMVQTKIET